MIISHVFNIWGHRYGWMDEVATLLELFFLGFIYFTFLFSFFIKLNKKARPFYYFRYLSFLVTVSILTSYFKSKSYVYLEMSDFFEQKMSYILDKF